MLQQGGFQRREAPKPLNGAPSLVDAAAQLPPAANLRRFLAAGADLVAFSGGKAIGGPQGSGILCGGHDHIMSAVLQQLDLDIAWEQWSPPPSLIDKNRLVGLPPHGIGRQCKVGKETIAKGGRVRPAVPRSISRMDSDSHARKVADRGCQRRTEVALFARAAAREA
jgi:hypothetical protein